MRASAPIAATQASSKTASVLSSRASSPSRIELYIIKAASSAARRETSASAAQ
jgi:hypothetical protein